MNNNSNRNNSNNNNRRRGRNNNRGGGGNGGGGIQGNRIDSRARGNAPQMLEKYRKLAHDASLNDDRVLTEYYLQFADHYFRVMADMKAQKDEQQLQRGPRPDRGADDDGEFDRDREDDFEARTRQYQPQNQQSYQPQPQRQHRTDADDFGEGMEGEADEGSNPFSPDRRPQRAERTERSERPERNERPERSERQERPERGEPRARKPARRRAEPHATDEDEAAGAGLDASILPPAIARADAEQVAETESEPPARKPLRVRTRKPRTDESDEPLEAVG